MLQKIIAGKKNEWLNSNECNIKAVIEYIRNKGELRDAQIEAIETYLFLKIQGGNKPLSQLFADGFFLYDEDFNQLRISHNSRQYFEKNVAAKSLYQFSKQKLNGGFLLPNLKQAIEDNTETLNYNQILKDIFYKVEYPDYLYSLPMGAGKTFLMAAFIYLDLYFAQNEPDNKLFAHNFLILVPSGLKSSIVPSLKSIERFDPSWVIPEPAAGNLKKILKFEVLDQPKSAKKSNKARNPNSQKVNNYQPFEDLKGLVMVVNAEKVILDRLVLTNQGGLIEKTDDEKDRQANELRNIIGKIPNLQIHIDEVHHAATDDIKLRQVVTKWNFNGSINSVLGYSGTPYLGSPDKIQVIEDVFVRFTQITNTVYYYQLTTAIKKFLKKPRVEQTYSLEPLQIIDNGVKDFLGHYSETIYGDGTCAKIAVYCGSIQRLEEQVYPYLTGIMKISPDLILKYHKGNKQYKISKESDLEFASLDTPVSKIKIILLVQVGKEGWDCKSLTGVILSQKGDCPNNMVLQTSCRCLRQVDKEKNETAIIWLNEDNAKILDKQLKEEQFTSIQELNSLFKGESIDLVQRYSRLDYLKLPPFDFYQLRVEFNTIILEETSGPQKKIEDINTGNHFNRAAVIERGLNLTGSLTKDYIQFIKGSPANFNLWLFQISKGSFNTISVNDLMKFELQLRKIFELITFIENKKLYFNDLYEHSDIQSEIRLAFHQKRSFETKTDIIPESANMLVVENLVPIPPNDKLYPSVEDTNKILHTDSTNSSLEIDEDEIKTAFNIIKENLDKVGMGKMVPDYLYYKSQYDFSPAVKSKNSTFHYLPYNFSQSAFELKFLKEASTLKEFKEKELEIYYNGERELSDFRIMCYSKVNNSWQRIGIYTPDFLIIKRKENKIDKILIVETKGSGFAEQTAFINRKHFIESEFLRMNNEKFGYRKFEYLFLQDDLKFETNLIKLNKKIVEFFEN